MDSTYKTQFTLFKKGYVHEDGKITQAKRIVSDSSLDELIRRVKIRDTSNFFISHEEYVLYEWQSIEDSCQNYIELPALCHSDTDSIKCKNHDLDDTRDLFSKFNHFCIRDGKARYHYLTLARNSCGIYYALRITNGNKIEAKRATEPGTEITCYGEL